MLKQRRELATRVAQSLFDAESAIDVAIRRTAHLVGLMPEVRQDAHFSALIGQDAIKQAIEAMSALGEARRGIVETHKELSIAQRQVGLGAVSVGDSQEKPPQQQAVTAQLREVSNAA